MQVQPGLPSAVQCGKLPPASTYLDVCELNNSCACHTRSDQAALHELPMLVGQALISVLGMVEAVHEVHNAVQLLAEKRQSPGRRATPCQMRPLNVLSVKKPS